MPIVQSPRRRSPQIPTPPLIRTWRKLLLNRLPPVMGRKHSSLRESSRGRCWSSGLPASCLELALALLMREVRWRCSNRQLSLVRLAIGHETGIALQDVAPSVPLSVLRRLGQGQVITSLGGA